MNPICTECHKPSYPRGYNAQTETCWTCEIDILSDDGIATVRPTHEDAE